MKLLDIISSEASLYNTLGKSGGTALPDNSKGVDTGPLKVWKKNPPFRKSGKRINEEQRGGEYDPSFAKFGNPNSDQEEGDFGWAKTKGGDSVTVSGKGRKTRKVIARKVGKNGAIEAIDDEGNMQLYKDNGKPATGKIDYKKMHTGSRANVGGGSELPESASGSGVGPAGLAGATQHPASGPAELEYDLTKVDDEFKGVDTRAEIKKSKNKRKTLKQYLNKRTDREVDRVTAGSE